MFRPFWFNIYFFSLRVPKFISTNWGIYNKKNDIFQGFHKCLETHTHTFSFWVHIQTHHHSTKIIKIFLLYLQSKQYFTNFFFWFFGNIELCYVEKQILMVLFFCSNMLLLFPYSKQIISTLYVKTVFFRKAGFFVVCFNFSMSYHIFITLIYVKILIENQSINTDFKLYGRIRILSA